MREVRVAIARADARCVEGSAAAVETAADAVEVARRAGRRGRPWLPRALATYAVALHNAALFGEAEPATRAAIAAYEGLRRPDAHTLLSLRIMLVAVLAGLARHTDALAAAVALAPQIAALRQFAPRNEAALIGRFLATTATCRLRTGDPAGALRDADDAVTALRSTGAPAPLALALFSLSDALWATDARTESVAAAREAVDLMLRPEPDDTLARADRVNALTTLSFRLLRSGAAEAEAVWLPAEAVRLAAEAVAKAREIGDPVTLAHALHGYGYTLGAAERLEDCAAAYRESADLRRGVVADIEETTRSIRKAIQDAERMAGVQVHEVYSGIALSTVHRPLSTGVAVTHVTFRALSPAELKWYLATEEWRGRAGAYAIQGRGSALVERIEGDFWNVVALPVPLLIELAPDLVTDGD